MSRLVNEVLKVSSLTRTTARIKVLDVLLESDYALVNAAIEKRLNAQVGRITIYRTLKVFRKTNNTLP